MIGLKIVLILIIVIVTNNQGYSQTKSKFVIYDSLEIVLEHARIVDVVKGTVLKGYSILLANGKIIDIKKTGKLSIPKNAQVVDLKGKTVLPGLIMLHEHMNYNNGAAVWQFTQLVFQDCF